MTASYQTTGGEQRRLTRQRQTRRLAEHEHAEDGIAQMGRDGKEHVPQGQGRS